MTETQTRLADDPQMPVAGSMVGDRYEVRSVLGEGGFARYGGRRVGRRRT